jgi:DNA-binding NarL/FixJ family response regulator
VARLGERWTDAQLLAAVAAVAAGLDVSDHRTPTGAPPKVRPVSRGRQGPAPEAGGDGAAAVTARELEIIEAVAAGQTNAAIAAAQGLSVNTVKFHLQAAFEKLGVHSRSQLVAEALRRGLITL